MSYRLAGQESMFEGSNLIEEYAFENSCEGDTLIAPKRGHHDDES